MKTNKNEPETYKSELIEDLLDSIPPEESEKIEKKMLIAAKIDNALKSKGWRKSDLLEALGRKNPSQISKWLSGTHNFTLDTLIDLERALDIRLIDFEDEQEQNDVIYILPIHFGNIFPDSNFNYTYRRAK